MSSGEEAKRMEEGGNLGALVRAFAPLVKKLARRYEGRGAEREDLEQEGYLALVRLARSGTLRGGAGRALSRHLPGYVRDAAARMRRRDGVVSLYASACTDDGEDAPAWAESLPDGRALEAVAEMEAFDEVESLFRAGGPDDPKKPSGLDGLDRKIVDALAGGMTQREIALRVGRTQQCVSHRIGRIRRVARRLLRADSPDS